MQRHKRAIARAAAADGWLWPAASALFATAAVTLWTLLH